MKNPYDSQQTLWAGLLLGAVALGLSADAVIFGLHAGLSVSEHIWAVAAAYPFVEWAGLIGGLLYTWLVREDWKLAFLNGVVWTHLWLAPVN